MPFRSLGLEPRILKAVQESGYTEPTPIQSAAIPSVLAGHDLIGIAQTGTGKTAAFTLPMLTMLAPSLGQGPSRLRALVVAPTRELAAQIQENVSGYARHLPLRAVTVFGGVSERPQIQALRQGVDMVIATPGRLIDLMGQRCVDFSALQFLVLDEADRMLDMGFLPSIRRIVQALPQRRQTLLFCATLSKEIETLTRDFQRSPKLVQVGRRSNPAETVTQLVFEVPQHLKMELLLHLLQGDSLDMVLVFSRTKHGADRVARKLEQAGIRTAALHANRSQNQRLRALQDFKSGAVRVLVATDIAARGIDVDGISHVVNYDLPMHPEDYVHRIGRTGRAHAVGDAISFVTPEDQGSLRSLERFIGRGIVRKKAEGFNYAAAPSPQSQAIQPSASNGRAGYDQRRGPARAQSQRPGSHRTGFPRQNSRQSNDGRSPARTTSARPQNGNRQAPAQHSGPARHRSGSRTWR